jgi:pseudouridine-5'-phosphate glycosidase
VIRLSDEVRESLDRPGARNAHRSAGPGVGGFADDAPSPVVALETTLVAHGFPPGEGVEVGLESERQVRAAGAVPATIGVLDGEIVVGLTEAELHRFDASARKLGPRDLAVAVAQRAVGATTVGGTLAVMQAVGIRWMATGGLGGVHRGFPDPPDVSADLAQLARTPALVVSAGVKSLLDVPATAELLESLGVPVLGYRVDTLPLFYAALGGPPVSARVESAREAAQVARAHWELGGGGLLVGRPPDEPLEDVEPLIEQALRAAHDDGVRGQAVTPYVLSYLHRESDGRTQRANKALIAQNSSLAGAIATATSG